VTYENCFEGNQKSTGKNGATTGGRKRLMCHGSL
jgi:hypothetical protein